MVLSKSNNSNNSINRNAVDFACITIYAYLQTSPPSLGSDIGSFGTIGQLWNVFPFSAQNTLSAARKGGPVLR